MTVFPAVDILGGKCVQLVQGKRETATVFGDPVDCARRWVEAGAEALHIINLDGAFGDSRTNAGIIRGILQETGIFMQLGGGIRSVGDARKWLETGVDRVILGTLAVREPESISTLSGEVGPSRIMASVDARAGQVVVEGWRDPGGDYLGWARRFEGLGAGSLLFTNVDVEGLQQGIRTEPVKNLLGATGLPVVVAGGITSLGDVATLRDLGASGVVLGSALYSGRIDSWEGDGGMPMRKGKVERKTAETRIAISIGLDGKGKASVETGIPFLDHMLGAFARHGRFDLECSASGDLEVDPHHLVEDTGIVLGQAIRKAIGGGEGISRFELRLHPHGRIAGTGLHRLRGERLPRLHGDLRVAGPRDHPHRVSSSTSSRASAPTRGSPPTSPFQGGPTTTGARLSSRPSGEPSERPWPSSLARKVCRVPKESSREALQGIRIKS